MQNFRDALDYCNLHDLDFEGDVFTWRNKKIHINGYIRERLDHVVATPEWCAHFPAYKVVNGDPQKSDHRPVVLWCDGSPRVYRQAGRERCFEAKWLIEDGCDGVVQEACEGVRRLNVHEKLAAVVKSLNTWSNVVLGDLSKRINKIKRELEAVRRQPISERQVRREQTLCFRLDKLEEQEDLV